MKKNILFVSFLFLFSIAFAQNNLKEKVCIVRPVYPESTVTFLKDFSASLYGRGYSTASKIIESYIKGGFGTGFVIKNEKGEYYIVTNRHVVQSAKYVTIEFLNKRDTIRYKECKVRAINEQVDLALVKLPAEAKFKDVFTIYNKQIPDGTDVFTAGFPGLGNKPSWQFGKGIISNSEVYEKELTNNDNIYVIQHTAQVDPGSSGGPLLIKDKTNPNNFKVVGVNTWKAIGRENANFSLPAIVVNKFLNKYLNTKPILNDETLKTQAKNFAQALKKDYKAVLPYISYSYISNITVNNFYDLLNATPDSVQKDVKKAFEDGMPIDGVRVALASAMFGKLKNKNIEFKQIDTNTSNYEKTTVQLSEKDKTIETIWVKEQGNWRISNMPSLKPNELGKNEIPKNFSYQGLFFIADMPFFNPIERSFALSYTFSNKFLIYDAYGGLALINKKIQGSEYDEKTKSYIDKNVKEIGLQGGFNIGLQLPIKIKPIYIIPNSKLLFGLTFSESDIHNGFHYGISGGLQIAYKIHTHSYIVFGLDLKSKKYALLENETSKRYTIFGINMGISF